MWVYQKWTLLVALIFSKHIANTHIDYWPLSLRLFKIDTCQIKFCVYFSLDYRTITTVTVTRENVICITRIYILFQMAKQKQKMIPHQSYNIASNGSCAWVMTALEYLPSTSIGNRCYPCVMWYIVLDNLQTSFKSTWQQPKGIDNLPESSSN